MHLLGLRLNELGNTLSGLGKPRSARVAYRAASIVAPQWSAPWFNLALCAKREGRFQECRNFGRRAADLDPNDPPTWWNLGIAATALGDWPTAREAWSRYGIAVPDGTGPIEMALGAVPIRLAPRTSGEVVWCRRLDPARAIIVNVPMPESGRGFGDLLLHDGEPRGTRILDGVETPVFDELELLAPSDLHTFTASVSAPRRADLQELEARADEARIPFEDWTSSIRFLCKCCSEGSPGQHEHHHEAQDEWKNLRSVAMAARTAECAQALLSDWSHAGTGRRADALVCALRRPPS